MSSLSVRFDRTLFLNAFLIASMDFVLAYLNLEYYP